eukprot:1141038-Pelagomonas_calceolata.AAC.4
MHGLRNVFNLAKLHHRIAKPAYQCTMNTVEPLRHTTSAAKSITVPLTCSSVAAFSLASCCVTNSAAWASESSVSREVT